MGLLIENNILYKYTSEPGFIFVVIPEGVTEIGEGAFSNCSELKNVIIPDTVTVIRKSAFYNCSGLTLLNLPDTITEIEEHAFEQCTGLTEVVIPPGIKTLSFDLFEKCTNLKKVVLPDGLNIILGGVFCDCSSLREINMPDSIAIIGGFSFKKCKSLEELFIPDSVKEIYQYAFSSCENLKKINLPSKLKEIENGLFAGCKNLCEIKIPDGVKSISERAFSYSGLEKIILPDSIEYVGWYAFLDCKNLHSVYLPDNAETEYINGAFKGCTLIAEVNIPESVIHIEDRCLHSTQWYTSQLKDKDFFIINKILYGANKNLITAQIPDGVTGINDWAFSSCKNLSSVIIPDSVKYVRDMAFGYIESLDSITFGKSGVSVSFYHLFYKEHMLIPLRDMIYNKTYEAEVEKEYESVKYSALTDCLNGNTENNIDLCRYIKKNIDLIIHTFIYSGDSNHILILAGLNEYIQPEKITEYINYSKNICNRFYNAETHTKVYNTLCEIQKKMSGQTAASKNDSTSVQTESDSSNLEHYYLNGKSVEDLLENEADSSPEECSKAEADSYIEDNVSENNEYEIIQFGNYAGEPLNWRILENKNDKILVIAENVIESRKSHNEFTEITWDKCDLRKWLNEKFYIEAFSIKEKDNILLSELINAPNPVCGTPGGENTQDYVFCISEDDAGKYFINDTDRMCIPSEHAKKNGIHEENNYKSCLWWLRSPGRSGILTSCVFDTGMIFGFGMAVHYGNIGVRPALWISAKILLS